MKISRAARLATDDVEQSTTVLLLVDFINPMDFEGAERLATRAVAAAQAATALRDRLGRDGFRTVYANDNYGRWNSDFACLWRRCVQRGGEAETMARALKPKPSDFKILKPRHSAFYSTPLSLILQQLGCTSLVIAGLATDNCVLFTAMDAYLRGYELWIPDNCTAAETDDAHRQALVLMASVLKAKTSSG